MKIENNKFLVTGGAGFIGSHLVDMLDSGVGVEFAVPAKGKFRGSSKVLTRSHRVHRG
jgi:nucleoside-diphosphate-sugar epimerase